MDPEAIGLQRRKKIAAKCDTAMISRISCNFIPHQLQESVQKLEKSINIHCQAKTICWISKGNNFRAPKKKNNNK